MFQEYSTKTNPADGPLRLKNLQKEMQKEGITAFLIPHADEHQNEYLPENAERLAWLTGFTGSAGTAIATLKSCHVFVDGRYTLQAKAQTHPDSFKTESLIDTPPRKWLGKNTAKNDVLGLDPWLTTISQFKSYESLRNKSGLQIKLTANLIDRIWKDQPAPPCGKVTLHPVKYSGESAEDKIKRVRKLVSESGSDLAILTDPASLAWLFNIRGSDMVHNPLALGFAIVPAGKKPHLFMASQKISKDVSEELNTLCNIDSPEDLEKTLSRLSNGKKVMCDPDLVPLALSEVIKNAGGTIVEARDPVVLPRATKNRIELDGARKAHIIDGVAMCKFLCWLDEQPPEKTSEIDAAKRLEEIRRSNAAELGTQLREISFDTISGHGPNGAIVHYRVTEDSNRQFHSNTLYLCDSGGQYLEGTTDITRTIAIGNPPESSVTDFTLVLKGHIAIATARFPVGTRGVDIDILARHALWQQGKDYAHGTGHGIGSYLNVHEGPQSISRRGMEKLVPGMIISNEPGYYVEGKYGIRIENLIIVRDAEKIDGGNVETLSFETITLCPVDRRLIDARMLSPFEKDWLNNYHERVRTTLGEYLNGTELEWLEAATQPI